MRAFNGGWKYQGGWVAIAGAVVGAYNAYSSSKSKSKSDKQSIAAVREEGAQQRQTSELEFQHQRWLAEQAEKWAREDAQRGQNYKEDAIAGFRSAAPQSALGQWGPAPARSVFDTGGLAARDSNGNPVYPGATNGGTVQPTPTPASNVIPPSADNPIGVNPAYAKRMPLAQFG